MRIVVISDTHGEHEKLGTLQGDVLIHCGDVEVLGSEARALEAVDDWFGRQRFEQIYCIGCSRAQLRSSPSRSKIWLWR